MPSSPSSDNDKPGPSRPVDQTLYNPNLSQDEFPWFGPLLRETESFQVSHRLPNISGLSLPEIEPPPTADTNMSQSESKKSSTIIDRHTSQNKSVAPFPVMHPHTLQGNSDKFPSATDPNTSGGESDESPPSATASNTLEGESGKSPSSSISLNAETVGSHDFNKKLMKYKHILIESFQKYAAMYGFETHRLARKNGKSIWIHGRVLRKLPAVDKFSDVDMLAFVESFAELVATMPGDSIAHLIVLGYIYGARPPVLKPSLYASHAAWVKDCAETHILAEKLGLTQLNIEVGLHVKYQLAKERIPRTRDALKMMGFTESAIEYALRLNTIDVDLCCE